MNSKVLTISIAGYNVENYIEKALDSLIIPSIIDKIEVFVVDDGGKDNTYKIAQRYEALYPNSIHAIHKENGGYGSTVNYTIEHSQGKYIKLLDGDDWYNTDELEEFVQKLENIDSDIVVTDYDICFFDHDTEHHTERISYSSDLKNGEISIETFNSLILKRPLGMWPLAIKTDILKKNNIRLNEKMLYTDQIFATLPFGYARTISYLNNSVYCYRIGRDGQSVGKQSRINHLNDAINVVQTLFTSYENNNNSFYSTEYISNRIAGYYLTAIRTIMLDKPNKKCYKAMIDIETSFSDISESLYNKAGNMGLKMSKVLRLLRLSNYKLYWLLALLPPFNKNWN